MANSKKLSQFSVQALLILLTLVAAGLAFWVTFLQSNPPEGRVTAASAVLREVFLDIGRKDGVSIGQLFVVFDEGAGIFDEKEHKAVISVTKIFDYRCMALVVEEGPMAPILKGDLVYAVQNELGGE